MTLIDIVDSTLNAPDRGQLRTLRLTDQAPLRGPNFECLVYRRGEPIDALDLDDYRAYAWPILQGLKAPSGRTISRLPLAPMRPESASAVARRLAELNLASLQVPKSMFDLFYYHALLTDIEAAGSGSGLPNAARWQGRGPMLEYGLSIANGTCPPSNDLTLDDIHETMWQALGDVGLRRAVPHLALDWARPTYGGLKAQLKARINDPRHQTASWAINRHALAFVAQTCSLDVNLSDAGLIQLAEALIEQIIGLQDRIDQSAWRTQPLGKAWPAFGQPFAPKHARPRAWRSDLIGPIVMDAIRQEILAPPNRYSLFRTADLDCDVRAHSQGKAYPLSFSASALMGALFDGSTGCCASAGMVHYARHFYVLNVPIDEPGTADLIYFPAVRGILRIVQSGEWFHPRLKAEHPGPNVDMWGSLDCGLNAPNSSWADHLFLSKTSTGNVDVTAFLHQHSIILRTLDTKTGPLTLGKTWKIHLALVVCLALAIALMPPKPSRLT